METAQENIIDLFEVVSEGKSLTALINEPPPSNGPDPRLTPAWEEKIAQLVREEVGRVVRGLVEEEVTRLVREEVRRVVRGAVEEEVTRLVREVLVQETEKALAREIERLKSS